jgi:hypothetical protein
MRDVRYCGGGLAGCGPAGCVVDDPFGGAADVSDCEAGPTVTVPFAGDFAGPSGVLFSGT